MSIINDLQNYRYDLQMIELLTKEINRFRKLNSDLTNINGTDQKKILRIIEQLNDHIDKTSRAVNRISELLNSIDDSELKMLLILRYIEGLNVKETAEQLGYSQGTIYYQMKKLEKYMTPEC